MYQQFFGLSEKPFVLTPNPRYVFYSERYREAEDQLLYAIAHGEGFMMVTGRPGTGKTTLCRDLLEKLDRSKYRSALMFNPFLNGVEMLATLLGEYGLATPPGASRKELLDALNSYLLAQLATGFRCIAIFDEAQHLSTEFLEQIRVLSNLETDSEKLIQIVLVGQPELLERIRTPAMAQLDQRVSVRCTLADLDEGETDRYIHHRLYVAGARGQVRFDQRAVREIRAASQGVPRVINLVADRALLAAYVAQTHEIGHLQVQKAVAALRGDDAALDTSERAAVTDLRGSRGRRGTKWMVAVAATLVLLAVGGGWALTRGGGAESPEALYWRASLARTPQEAQRLFQRLATEHPRTSRSEEALMRLTEMDMARGDRTSALQHLALLRRDFPRGPLAARVGLFAAQIHLAGGDSAAACEALASSVSPAHAEPDRAAIAAACATRAQSARAASVSTPPARADSAAVPPATAASPSPAASFSLRRTPSDSVVVRGGRASPAAPAATAPATAAPSADSDGFAIQVAAYADELQARELARRLARRGYDARVAAHGSTYRVRLGSYRTLGDANAAAQSLRSKKVIGFVVAEGAQ